MQNSAIRKDDNFDKQSKPKTTLHTIKTHSKNGYQSSTKSHYVPGRSFYEAMCDIFPHFRVFCVFFVHALICVGLAELLSLWSQTSPSHVTGLMIFAFCIWSLDMAVVLISPIAWLLLRAWFKQN